MKKDYMVVYDGDLYASYPTLAEAEAKAEALARQDQDGSLVYALVSAWTVEIKKVTL